MPNKLPASEKLKFARAKVLSKNRDTAGVVAIMKELSVSNPESAKIRAVLANAYWDLGDLTAAAREFRKAVTLAPDFELASIGLFHCLWEQSRTDEAFQELKRFMAIADSEDYRQIITELGQID